MLGEIKRLQRQCKFGHYPEPSVSSSYKLDLHPSHFNCAQGCRSASSKLGQAGSQPAFVGISRTGDRIALAIELSTVATLKADIAWTFVRSRFGRVLECKSLGEASFARAVHNALEIGRVLVG